MEADADGDQAPGVSPNEAGGECQPFGERAGSESDHALHLAEGVGKEFGYGRCERPWRNWKGPSDGKSWNWIFSEMPCDESRSYAGAKAAMARRHLRGNPAVDASARRNNRARDVRTGQGEPGELLPKLAGARTGRGGDGDPR